MMRSPSRRRRSPITALLAGLLVLGLANLALASAPQVDDGAVDSSSDTHGHNHAQHGSDSGHLPSQMEGDIEFVGRMRINQNQVGRASDVAVLGDHAYIGAFAEPRCQKGGVYVFDISDPTTPKQVNFIRTGGNSYVGEGVQAISIDTPSFTGDVLVMNNEICGPQQPSTVGGVTFVDVTDPKRHRMLAEGVGDTTSPSAFGPGLAHASHSAFMWTVGEPGEQQAYAVIIDNEESADLDILDLTDPRSPELIAEYDLNAGAVTLGDGTVVPTDFPIIDDVKGVGESFSHDMVVQELGGRQIMLASYWDGGYVQLDVTDPTAPIYLGDTDFAEVDEELFESTGDEREPEGNAHQAEWTGDGAYFIGADEDFNPYSTTATAGGTPFSGANAGSDTPALQPGQAIAGQAVFVGRACPGDPTPPPLAPGQIAVAERGVCDFTVKVAAIEAAGDPDAIIIFNRTAADGCTSSLSMTVAGSTPTFGVVPRDAAFGWFGAPYDQAACLAGDGTQQAPIALGATGPEILLESYFDGWGYVRLFGNTPGADGTYPLLDTYAIPEAHDPGYAEGFGDLSVHEVAASQLHPERLYFAYYAGGFRVVEIQDEQLVEVASFIDVGGSNFWGVQLWTPTSGEYAGEELILASDRDYGVYIFRYAPEAEDQE